MNPRDVCLFIPPGLKGFKMNLFNRIGSKIGKTILHDFKALEKLPDEIIPAVGCTPELKPLIQSWKARGRRWIYWDRGYARRIFATDLPTGDDGGYYRWHVGSFQMKRIRPVPGDRWKDLKTEVWPWARDGKHVVVAEPSPTYEKFHGIEGWTKNTVMKLKQLTDRPLVIRDKEMQRFGRKLHQDLRGAHCLVTHGSNAAVEAVIMGCPVFVDREASAAALVGRTILDHIEQPVYPDRQPWLNSLAYCQFNEEELVDGTLWNMIE